MQKVIRFLPFLIFLLIFKNWFTAAFITARDFPYYFAETIHNWPLFPPAWSPHLGNGFGGEHFLYALDTYIYFIIGIFVNKASLPWEIVYKIFIFGLFLFLSVYSSIYLLKKTLSNPSIWQMLITALLFSANTYILMVLDGGQIGVALAYSLTPLVLARFMVLQDTKTRLLQNSLLVSLLLAVQIMFDARLVLLTLIPVFGYAVFFNKPSKKIFWLCVPILTAFLLHLTWILPTLLFGSSLGALAQNNTREIVAKAFEFFSFANFSVTLSLLHPNWPENIFGKTYFMKVEYLFLPIVAFSSLLFLQGEKEKTRITILFFALLGILGAFLAKGANPPFGEINTWIFTSLPGSAIFRDSTKFYLWTILAYAILVPYALSFFQSWINTKNKLLSYAPSVIAIFYLLFIIHPVFLGQLSGTFKQYEMPQEYRKLNDFLVSDANFSRTLWIPMQHRFNFYSYSHPAIAADNFFNATSSAEILEDLYAKNAQQKLADLSIGYVIVPDDTFGEIFIDDRKYDMKAYREVLEKVDGIAWLNKIEGFGNIGVFKTKLSSSDHFRLSNEGEISYTMNKPDEYTVKITSANPTTLVFVENYSPYWKAVVDRQELESNKTEDGFNSFFLQKGSQSIKVYYSIAKLYDFGRMISGLTLIVIVTTLFLGRKNSEKS